MKGKNCCQHNTITPENNMQYASFTHHTLVILTSDNMPDDSDLYEAATRTYTSVGIAASYFAHKKYQAVP